MRMRCGAAGMSERMRQDTRVSRTLLARVRQDPPTRVQRLIELRQQIQA